jgi:photosystem II stability/assembly factor-like uncharacterized protein
MKNFFVFLLLIVSTPCAAQWRDVGFGNISGSNFGTTVALGVHDNTIFQSFKADRGFEVDVNVLRYVPPATWEEADSGIDYSQGNVTSFASLGPYFFAGQIFLDGSNAGEYSSTDNGAHWNAPKIGSPVASNGTYLFGGWGNIGIARSRDSGNNWKQVANLTVNNFAAHGACILASTTSGIWRSTDSGTNWAKITTPAGLSLSAFATIDTQIFAGGLGIFRSTDSGANWTQFALAKDSVYALASHGKYLFAGTDSGVFVSSDSGIWKNVSDNMGAQPGYYPKVRLLAVLDTQLFAFVDAGYQDPLEFGYVTARPFSEMEGTSAVRAASPQPSDTIELYPNPATGLVTILAGGTNILGVSVLNVLGEDMLDMPNVRESDITLDLSKLPSGTYFVQIQTGNGSVLRKVIRE